MSHIVIIGAGANGLSMAYEMRELARADDRITVVANDPQFHAVLDPWESASAKEQGNIDFQPGPRLEKKGIGFTAAGAKRVHPEKNKVDLGDGSVLDYDYLVIAAGPKLAFDEIEGLGPAGYTQAVCDADLAVFASDAWGRFVADPGPLVVGAAQGSACFGPAYQLAQHIEADLRRRGIRDRVDMTFVTAEPYIGHLGLNGVDDSRRLLESALRDHHIAWIANARVNKVESGNMYVTEHGTDGKPMKEHLVPFKYSMMLPASGSIDALSGIDGLVNRCGFVLVDECHRNPKYGNIYAAGVSVAPAQATEAGSGAAARKTAYTIESVVTSAANNIREQIDGKPPSHQPVYNEVGVANLGAAGIGFVGRPQSASRGAGWFSAGNWIHLSQCASCEGGGGEVPQAKEREKRSGTAT